MDISLPLLSETKATAIGKHLLERVKVSPIGAERLKVRGIFQAIDVVNENNRRYPESIWDTNLGEDSPLMQRTRARKTLGELEHPESGTTHLGRVSHLIENVWKEELTEGNPFEVPPGKYVIGEALIFNTPSGQILQELYTCGVPVGISSRGRGDTRPGDDCDIVEDNYEAETWDFVYQPSVTSAYPSPVGESKSISTVAESVRRANVLLSEASKLEGKDIIELVELGGNMASIAKALASKPDAVSTFNSLNEKCRDIVKVIRTERESFSSIENQGKPEIKKRGVTVDPQESNDRQVELATQMAIRAVKAESQLKALKSSTHKGDGKKLSEEHATLKKRYNAAVKLADSLLQRARSEKHVRAQSEKKTEAAIALAEAMRTRISKAPVVDSKREIEPIKEDPAPKQPSAQVTEEKRIHNPAGTNEAEVQVESKPKVKSFMTLMVERTEGNKSKKPDQK